MDSTQVPAEYDVVISGGGVSGCLAALALSRYPHLKIALVEAGAPTHITNSTQSGHGGFDARVIALSKQSLVMLEQLGVNTSDIAGEAITDIHVSDRGHVGKVHLSAAQDTANSLHVNAANQPWGKTLSQLLGKVVAISELGEYLLSQVKQAANVHYIYPARISAITPHQAYHHIDLQSAHEHANSDSYPSIRAKLVLVSDGAQSSTASMLGFQQKIHDYEQSALITNVTVQLPHKGMAFERFTSQGPLAFLPMFTSQNNAQNNRTMSVVWCMNDSKLESALSLSSAAFMQTLNDLFGYRLGRIENHSKVHSYPLRLVTTHSFTQHRALCIGNAAQALHPIAGQGFNLGIRDVFDAVQTIGNYADVGCHSSLQAYNAMRKQDKALTIGATNTLVSVFSNQYWPMVVGRNAGLHIMNHIPASKRAFAQFAMGNR
ncbi:MAG: FAD-dependent monooxygenase [Glaciecola sp.]